MKHCKACNYFYEERCQKCVARLFSSDRVPYRVSHPQAWPRCHRCWNLSPVCHCDGSIAFGELPQLSTSLS